MMKNLISILSISMGLTACYSAPTLETIPDAGLKAPCTGLEPSCKQMNVNILIDTDPTVKLSKADKKQKSHSVFGRCELLVENGNHAPTSYPCTELRVSLTKNSGEERNTWLQGNTFEIDDMGRGPYTFKAFSDQYLVGSSKAKINPGQPLKIEIRISSPAVKTATGSSAATPGTTTN